MICTCKPEVLDNAAAVLLLRTDNLSLLGTFALETLSLLPLRFGGDGFVVAFDGGAVFGLSLIHI